MTENNGRLAITILLSRVESLDQRVENLTVRLDEKLTEITKRLNYIDERLSKLEGKQIITSSFWGGIFGSLAAFLMRLFLR